MAKKIPLPTVAEILEEEFMQPYGITAYRLAKEIGVPVSRIQDILHGRRRLSIDTALRLSKFFNMSDSFFVSIQTDIEIRQAKNAAQKELEYICPVTAVYA